MSDNTRKAAVRYLSVQSYSQGFTLWHYRGDTLADVSRGAFWQPVADMLGAGDMILVSATDGAVVLFVPAIAGDVVTVAPLASTVTP